MSIVSILILANVAAYLLASSADPALIASFALWPPGAGFMPWQPITYAFLHANLAHLGVNMYGLWMFGRDVETLLGRKTMSKLYLVSVLAAGATQLLVGFAGGLRYATVGASGGVFGILLAYGMAFPRRTVVLLFPPLPMPVWMFVSLYAAIELVLGVTGTDAGVAHFAHLGGMAGAYLVLRRTPRPVSS